MRSSWWLFVAYLAVPLCVLAWLLWVGLTNALGAKHSQVVLDSDGGSAMHPGFAFVLILLAAICFFLAAFNVPVRRVNLLALGLALVSVVWLVQAGTAAF